MAFPRPVTATRCVYCHAPASGGQTVCDKPTCQTRHKVTQAAALAIARDKRRAQAAELARARTEKPIGQAKRRLRGTAKGPIATVVAPFLDLPVAPLPDDRRTEFLAHLDSVLKVGFARPTDDITLAQLETYRANLPGENPALDVTCMSCRGLCCMQGNQSRAFLTDETIQMLRLVHPGDSSETMRAFYLAHLPPQSVERSCVFHGPVGCTLPRDRRADICNAFQCSARQDLAQQMARPGARRAVSVALCSEHHKRPEPGAPVMRAASFDPANGLRPQDGLTLPALPPQP